MAATLETRVALPALEFAYEARCATIMHKVRGATPTAVSTTATRDPLSSLLRFVISRAVARHVDGILVAITGQPALAEREFAPDSPVAHARVAILRGINRRIARAIQDHYTRAPAAPTTLAWLRGRGFFSPGDLPPMVVAWLTANSACRNCVRKTPKEGSVMATPLPKAWLPPGSAPTSAGHWADSYRKRDFFARETPFEHASMREAMSLELLAYIAVVLVHDAAEECYVSIATALRPRGPADPWWVQTIEASA